MSLYHLVGILLVVGDRLVVEPGLRELGLPLVVLDSNGKEVE